MQTVAMVDSAVKRARRTGAARRAAGGRTNLGRVRAELRTDGLTKDHGSGRGVFGLDLDVREDDEPLRNGVDLGNLAVPAASAGLLAVAAAGFRDRDLRG